MEYSKLSEFSVEEHDTSGVTETQFYLSSAFPTQESAIEAAIQGGRQKIDVGFELGPIALPMHRKPLL
jgi:hypothetical protein